MEVKTIFEVCIKLKIKIPEFIAYIFFSTKAGFILNGYIILHE